MKICAVYGTERRGCTWHIAQEVLSRLPEAEVTEFFLPRDCPDPCVSCFRCFNEENRCYHSEGAGKILDAMLEADVIVLTSPVYALHLTGQMKTFLDHYASMWMVHRPNGDVPQAGGGHRSRQRSGVPLHPEGDEGQLGFLGRGPDVPAGLYAHGDQLGPALPKAEAEHIQAGGADGGEAPEGNGSTGNEGPRPVLRHAAGAQVPVAGLAGWGLVAVPRVAGGESTLERKRQT